MAGTRRSGLGLILLAAAVILTAAVAARVAAASEFTSLLAHSPYSVVAGPAPEPWDRSDPHFALKLVAARQPRVFTGSPADDWRAFSKWDPSYLQGHVPELTRTYSHSSPSITFYDATRPMASLPGVRWESAVSFVDLSTRAFYEREGTANEWLYYTGPLGLWPAALAGDLAPLGFLTVNPSFKPSTWLGHQGVIAHPHYDVYHNLYVMVRGRKTFHLFGPEQSPLLRLHPRLHPGHRQSQVNFSDVAETTARFPSALSAVATEIVLQPGQVLYLPPFWYHRVEALDSSISVNVWSDTEEAAVLAKADTVPFDSSWPPPLRLLVLRNYAAELIAKAAVFDVMPSVALGAMHAHRFAPIAHILASSASAPLTAACARLGLVDLDGHNRMWPASDRASLTPAQLKAILLDARERARDSALTLSALPSKAVRRYIVVPDLLEELAALLLGVENVEPFFRLCGEGSVEGTAAGASRTEL